MTAVLPETRPSTAGRHRAPEDAITGPMGIVPAARRGRTVHGEERGRTAPTHSAAGQTPHFGRAARTAGLSLAALGALATAGGLATDGLIGSSSAEPPATGEIALSPQLASADLSLARPMSSDAATSSVMPVVPAAAAATPVKHDSPVSRAAAARTPQAASQRSGEGEDSASAGDEEAPAASSAGSSAGARALAIARGKIGVPYEWGATGPSSFDCSGLTQWAFGEAGEDIPRTSSAQSRFGQRISMDDLQPGDLIFFNSPVSHVAMYAGDGKMLEAPNSGNDVRISSLSRRLDDAVGARRI